MNRFSVAAKCLPWKLVNLLTLTLLLSYLAKLSAASDLPSHAVEPSGNDMAEVIASGNLPSIPTEPSPTSLNINSFSSQELAVMRVSNCGTLLSESADPDNFVFATIDENNGNGAIMKIEGEWVRFFPDSNTPDSNTVEFTKADVGFIIHKNYTSNDNVYTLKSVIHFGEAAGGYTPIPDASLSIHSEGFSEVSITATGANCH